MIGTLENDTLRDDGGEDEPRLLLLMEAGENRSLLVEALSTRYRVETGARPEALDSVFDLCIVGSDQFGRVADRIRTRREEETVFLPFLLLTEEGHSDETVLEYVDDVLELPVKKAELLARVGNLVDQRKTAVELAEQEAELAATVDDLRRKEKAIDEAPIGLTISDPAQPDNPVAYANEQFNRQTGYPEAEVLGRNCRFLQGEETDQETRAKIREAVDAEEPVSVDIVNYRKNGEKFWNKLDIAPVRDESGSVINYVGFQTDITDRKIRERRTEVLNRVLSHNLRNKMNIIQVYSEMLGEEFDGETPESLEKIEEAASSLLTLAETVRETDRILSQTDADGDATAVGERLKQVMSGFRDRYPEAEFDLTVPEEECSVSAGGLIDALVEAIDNAVKHNDSPEPTVEVRVSRRDTDWIDIEIRDNGPGIPDQEIEVLQTGEAALRHADRMGIWLIYWTVSRAGGTMRVEKREGGGTALSIAVPAADCERDGSIG